MSLSKKIAKNTVISGIDLSVSIVFGFLVVPILLGRLGEEVFGIYSLILVFSVGGFLSFFDLGLEGALTKYLAKYDGLKDYDNFTKYFWNGLTLYLIIGLAIFLILFVTIYLIGVFPFNIPSNLIVLTKNVLLIYIYQFPFQFLSLGFRATLTSVHKFGALKTINMVYILCNFLLIYFQFKSEHDFIEYIYYFNAIFVVKCFFEFLVSVRVMPSNLRFKVSFQRPILKELYGFAKFLFLSKLVGFIYNFTDKLIISFFMPIANLSKFNILVKMPNLISSISSVLNSTIISVTSNLSASNNDKALKSLFIKGTNFKMIIIIPIVIVSALVSDQFIELWVGKEYSDLAFLSVILLIQFAFSQFTSLGSTMMVGSGFVKEVLPYSIFGSIVNIVISLSFLSKLGLLSLVLGTTISHAIIFMPYTLKMMSLYQIPKKVFWLEIRKTLLSFVLFIGVCVPIRKFFDPSNFLMLGIEMLLMLSLYFLMALLFVLGEEDKKRLRRIIKI
ncbi:oligosaccharide flippase family protein [Reichenbachiella sp. MALMAid0571]|uniref:oligosaccharide flippase family protein n=1 Tax=Reichenbachiella sp. MALMAid0571 TaxID=3143939 RepID=UPI0032DF2FF5